MMMSGSSSSSSGGVGVGVGGGTSVLGRTVLDCIMHKLPSTRKYYRVSLIVPENGIPIIEYYQARGSASRKKPRKIINFIDLWHSDRKQDTNEKFAFSIYTINKTVTFLAQDETTMNEWLSKIREYHSKLYPELTQYDAIFEATLLEKGLGKTMNIHGPYRLALCKESLDLVPLLTPTMIEQLQQQQHVNQKTSNSSQVTTTATTATANITTKSLKLPLVLANRHHHHHHQHHHHHPSHQPSQSLISFREASSTSKRGQSDDDDGDDDANNDFMHLDSHQLISTSSSTAATTTATTLASAASSSTHSAAAAAAAATNTPNPLHHPHLPQHLPSEQRFSKRHPWVTQKTIQLARRSIRRCGHTDSNFYIESGRHSTIGEGDLWFALNKKSTARNLHELLLATIRTAASQADDQFLCKAPRSRSGSSSDNAHYRSQQSRSSSLVCLNNNNNINNNNNNNNINNNDDPTTTTTDISVTSNNNNNNIIINSYNQQPSNAFNQSQGGATATTTANQLVNAAAAAVVSARASKELASSLISTIPMFSSVNQSTMSAPAPTSVIQSNNGDQIDEDCGYLPMA